MMMHLLHYVHKFIITKKNVNNHHLLMILIQWQHYVHKFLVVGKNVIQVAVLAVYKAPEVLQLRACVSALTEFLKEFPARVRVAPNFPQLAFR